MWALWDGGGLDTIWGNVREREKERDGQGGRESESTKYWGILVVTLLHSGA